MKTLKLSTISHVRDIKFEEGLRGGAYFDVIIHGKKIQIYPHVFGWGRESVAIYHDGKIDVVVGDNCYEGRYEGWYDDRGPRVSMSSKARPASELYEQLGFAIDVNS